MVERISFQSWRAGLKARQLLAGLIGNALCVAVLPAYATMQPLRDLADMSLEELANLKITSVSKKAERLADAAASVFVITSEDIRRSGASSLPEALRLAPNLQVAQVSASGYAISARGMNGSNSSAPNKLLVLIDGRSVYTPLFSGVFWDVQDVMIEDVERIEVISGPGGTLWGTNAVNGVVNVITRSATDTQGALIAAGGGNRSSDLAFRYGGTAGANGAYRVYGKYFEREHTSTEDGRAVNDAWRKSQLGFRADWRMPSDKFMVQGNAYKGAVNQPEPGSISIGEVGVNLGEIDISGVNLTAQWTHALEDNSSLSLQLYYDRTERKVPPYFNETLDIIDAQFQHTLQAIGAHALVWGASYRYSMDNISNRTARFGFLPADVNQKWVSLFAQDEITLRKDLRLTLGARMERNVYTGTEFLPSARLAWNFAPDHMLWTAASRAVRAPSRLDRDTFIPASPPFLLAGGAEVRSEVSKVYELGYRGQAGNKLAYSATLFHIDYDHLRTQEIAPSGTFLTFDSKMEGSANGIEMWTTYRVSPSWRLSAGFTALDERLRLKPGSNDLAAPNAAGKNPSNTWQLRSALNIDERRELDFTIRHSAALQNPDVPSYTAVDARFGWKLRRDIEFSIIGQNLLSSHAEYGPVATRSEIPSSVFLKLSWRG